MNVLYSVNLADSEREQLLSLLTGGHAAVRRFKRANILPRRHGLFPSAHGLRALDATLARRALRRARRPRVHLARHRWTAAPREGHQALAEGGVCIPEVDADFVAHMEDALDLYAEPPDPLRPVV